MRSFLWILGLLLIAGLVYYGVRATTTPVNLPLTTQPTKQPIGGSPGNVTSQVKTFTIEAMPFEFNPKEIRVKKGDAVKITFVNNEGTHDFVIDKLNIRTKQIPAGQSDTVEFMANTTGTFEYYCSVGNGYHRQQGMVGNLIVEE